MKYSLFVILIISMFSSCDNTKKEKFLQDYENQIEVARVRRYTEYPLIDNYFKEIENVKSIDLKVFLKEQEGREISIYSKLFDVFILNGERAASIMGSLYGEVVLYDPHNYLKDIKIGSTLDIRCKIVKIETTSDKTISITKLRLIMELVNVDNYYEMGRPMGEDRI